MQDRYVGDVGDFGKYALLRHLTGGKRLGVAWYLYPDESHNADGKHVRYLEEPGTWRDLDPVAFEHMGVLVQQGLRCVAAVEASGVLPDAVFASERLDCASRSASEREAWRREWFERVQARLTEAEVVFADPDNGLYPDDGYRWGRVKHWKSIPLSEVAALADGRCAVIYHHNTRRKGGHEAEIRHWLGLMPGPAVALRVRAYSPRTYFIVNPTPDIEARARAFAEAWPKTELMSP